MRDLLAVSRPRTIEQCQPYIDKPITIIEKIMYSQISKEQLQAKITDLETRQVPQRTVLLKLSDAEVAEYWFKNWLHPNLKNFFRLSPADKRGCSKEVLERDQALDILHFYENGQQNYDYTLEDIKAHIAQQVSDEKANNG